MFEGTSVLLVFAVILAFGGAGGYLASRLRLPALTGQILVGVLLGGAGLNVLPTTIQHSFYPITSLALSLIAVTVGGHLEFRRLHNAFHRIVIISICQFMVVFWTVLIAFQVFDPFNLPDNLRLPVHLLIASIATSSSPISIIHIIKGRRARGLLVKTSIAVLAINNLLTIFAFEILHGVGAALITPRFGITQGVLIAILAEVLSIGIGLICGLVLVVYCRKVIEVHSDPVDKPTQRMATIVNGKMFTAFLLAICFTSGLCEFLTIRYSESGLHPSPVLANMMLGLVLANGSAFKEELLRLFQTLETGIFTFFFVVAGAHLDLHNLRVAWLAALIFFLIRGVAMVGGGYLGGRLSHSTRRNSLHIGRILLSQGAIAITLSLFLESTPLCAGYAGAIATAVVAASLVSEIVGPILFLEA